MFTQTGNTVIFNETTYSGLLELISNSDMFEVFDDT